MYVTTLYVCMNVRMYDVHVCVCVCTLYLYTYVDKLLCMYCHVVIPLFINVFCCYNTIIIYTVHVCIDIVIDMSSGIDSSYLQIPLFINVFCCYILFQVQRMKLLFPKSS